MPRDLLGRYHFPMPLPYPAKITLLFMTSIVPISTACPAHAAGSNTAAAKSMKPVTPKSAGPTTFDDAATELKDLVKSELKIPQVAGRPEFDTRIDTGVTICDHTWLGTRQTYTFPLPQGGNKVQLYDAKVKWADIDLSGITVQPWSYKKSDDPAARPDAYDTVLPLLHKATVTEAYWTLDPAGKEIAEPLEAAPLTVWTLRVPTEKAAKRLKVLVGLIVEFAAN